MSNLTTSAARIAAVRSIGAAEAKCATVAEQIVASVPESFDWTGRGVIAEQVHLWATGTDDKNERPAQRKQVTTKDPETGEEVTVNEVTNYGRGVNSLVAAVKRLITVKDDAPKSRVLRVSLSGEGGGSTVVAEDHPLYAALVALITGDADADADAA